MATITLGPIRIEILQVGVAEIRVVKPDGEFHRFCVAPDEIPDETPGWEIIPESLSMLVAEAIAANVTEEQRGAWAELKRAAMED